MTIDGTVFVSGNFNILHPARYPQTASQRGRDDIVSGESPSPRGDQREPIGPNPRTVQRGGARLSTGDLLRLQLRLPALYPY